jgi:hypothetical protein
MTQGSAARRVAAVDLGISTAPAPAPPRYAIEPSAYLTDGSRLYRVVSSFAAPPRESFAVLEDCATLELSPHSPDELWEMGLRLVRAGRGRSR